MEKILAIDDNETNLKILKLILSKEGYDVHLARNAEEVFAVLKEGFDLILLDIGLPDIDGYEICKKIKQEKNYTFVPIIFVSALSEQDDIVKGFAYGATDYITKPFMADVVKARVRTHLQIANLQRQLEEANKGLEAKVQEQVKKIRITEMETIFSLAKLAQSRDDETGSHLKRVQKYCDILTLELKKNSPYSSLIDDDFIENISYASSLHDVGKVGISDLILLKEGKLTDEEYDIIKTHTLIGAKTLSEVYDKFNGNNKFIEMGITIARSHHERYDGSGYPDGLKGEEIPLAARIMAIADVYDALRAKRPYKEPLSHDESVKIIQEGRGTQFDPYITDCFVNIADLYAEISDEFQFVVSEV